MRKLVILAREAGYDIEPGPSAWSRWCLRAVKKALSITSSKMVKS
jgi:hypothetical protein